MKRLFFSLIIVITMSGASFAGNVKQFTQEYLFTKYFYDQYEQSLDKANSCEDLDKARAVFLSNLDAISVVIYSDDDKLTQEEQSELDSQLERIQKKVEQLQESWNCLEEESEDDASSEEFEMIMAVEKMPEFPGGFSALSDYLAKNVKYPEKAREAGIQGRVFVSFFVEKDGSLDEVKVMRSLGGGCDEEAIRVVKAMPKWIPGEQRGKPVRVSFMLPIYFKP